MFDGFQFGSDVLDSQHEKMNDSIVDDANSVCKHRLQMKAFRKMFEFFKMAELKDNAPRFIASLPKHSCLHGYSDSVVVLFGDKIGPNVIHKGDLESFADERIGNQALAEVTKEFRSATVFIVHSTGSCIEIAWATRLVYGRRTSGLTSATRHFYFFSGRFTNPLTPRSMGATSPETDDCHEQSQ